MRSSTAKQPDNNLKLSIIFLTAAITVAFIMRMISYSKVTANGGITFMGYDDFYHMRLILYTASNFPHSLNFDSYINYPSGYEIGWPPLFDVLGALLAKILGGGQPDLHTVEFAGALLPVLIGVLTIIPLYLAAATVFDKKTGLLAAFTFAILPAHIYVSRFGGVDHHVVETLLTTTSYALFILALKSAREGDISLTSLKNISSEKKALESLAFAGASGLFLALLVFTWIGAPAFISLIVLYAFIQSTIDLKTGKQSDYLFICSTACLLATLLFTVPLSAAYARPGFEMSAMYLSWFQIFYVLSMIVGAVLLWGISKYISKKDQDWRYYPGILILVLGGSLLFLRILSAESYSFVIEGIRFFFGKGEYMGTITEAMPLFLTSAGKLTFSPALGAFGLSLVAALAGFFLLALEWRGDKQKPEVLFFLLWSIFSTYLVLSQRRFAYQFVVNVAILTSYVLWVLLESLDFETEVRNLINSKLKPRENVASSLQTRKEAKSNSKSKSRTRNMSVKNISGSKNSVQPDYFKIVSSIALVGLVFIPCLWWGISFAKGSGSLDPEWQESLNWLKTSSPETSYYLQPSEAPEYGVLSWWDYGNWIIYISQRPAVSNNFQTGVEDSANFFMSNSEQSAKAILEKDKVKYVVNDTLMVNGKFGAIVQLAGKNISDYYDFNTVSGNDGLQQRVAAPKKEFSNIELYKLHNLDGSNLGNLRLVHESSIPKEIESHNNTVKIFEYVRGARLSGAASPDQPVNLTLNLKSNTGREFTYKNKAVADKNGSFEITVPYSTEKTGSGVSAISDYSLNAGGNAAISGIQVKENDILSGNRIEVKATKAK